MNTNNTNNIDILEELEQSINNTPNIIDEIETIQIPELEIKEENQESIVIEKEVISEVKTKSSFLSWIIAISKYTLTSALIFAVLLITTNYNAYINIAKSYIFQEEMVSTQQKLITSVEATNIKEKYSDIVEKKIKIDKEEADKLSIKKMKKEQDKENVSLSIEMTPYDNRVIIPKIGENIPLIDIKNRNIEGENELNDIFMEELERWIIRYPGSAKPWEKGASFIFGHSSNFPWIKWEYNEVFALLDNVVYDDEVIVYYNQKKYVYKIKEKKIISPWDVSILERNKGKSEIILMTCWPIGTTLNRIIVIWELVEQ